jgi:hypothetical protein
MAAVTSMLTESLQALVDARLDTIDRMLVGRVPRADRLSIVREVESQVFELLQERATGEPTRDDVLAVLSRLDPPEAYLPEGDETFAPAARAVSPARPAGGSSPSRELPRTGKVSGILGLCVLTLILLSPMILIIAESMSVTAIAYLLMFGTLSSIVILGILGVVLAAVARVRGAWAVVGLVLGIIGILFSMGSTFVLLA